MPEHNYAVTWRQELEIEISHVEHQGASEDIWRKEQFGMWNRCHGRLQGNIQKVRGVRAGNESSTWRNLGNADDEAGGTFYTKLFPSV